MAYGPQQEIMQIQEIEDKNVHECTCVLYIKIKGQCLMDKPFLNQLRTITFHDHKDNAVKYLTVS